MVDIAASGWHSAAVSAFGDLYTWGWNVNGQLGLPTYKEVEVKYVNNKSQIMQRKLPSVFPAPQLIDLPVRENDSDEDLNAQHDIVKVSAGVRHTVVATRAGILLGAGWNRYGQLGVSEIDEIQQFQTIPIEGKLPADSEVICSDWCTVLLTTE